MPRGTTIALTLLAGAGLAGCKTFPSGDMAPAALIGADDNSKAAIKSAAAKVLGRETVELGASDFSKSPAVSILPERSSSPTGAPFNQQDFAIPTMLLMMTDGKNCFLVKEDTRDWAHIAGVDCKALGGPPPT